MEVTISAERFEDLVASMAKDLVKHSWTMCSSVEGIHLLVFGIDTEGNLRHFRTIIDK